MYALHGIKEMGRERNFAIQLVIGAIAIISGFILRLPATEKMIVVLCVALVLGSEAMNSATERLLNFVSREYREEIHEIKDLMAAAVLIFSIAALVIGIWIFTRAIF